MHLLPNILNRRIHHGYHFHPHLNHARRRHRDVEKGAFRTQAGDPPRTSTYVADHDSLDPLLESADHVEANLKKYRFLPIFSGIMVPFAVMLAIPSLTSHWYVRTDDDNITVETKPNPLLLNVGMAFSLACGVLANICLVIRFAERHVRWMTLGAIAFLTLHDLINIPAVIAFAVIHRFDDGFIYGQPFWFTLCSTMASTLTNVTLIIDMVRIQDFVHSGSGLTSKQRSLVIISIILLTYVSFGALIQAKIQNIAFIDALYFSVVSIETIGFGDIPLKTSKARIFTCFYIGGGLLNIALAVSMARDALLEAAVINFRTRRRMHERERRLRHRWRAAVRWRLRLQGHPVWVHHTHKHSANTNLPHHDTRHWYRWILNIWDKLYDKLALETEDPSWRFLRGPRHRRLNVEALTDSQLHAAALEAGAPLIELVPATLGIPRQHSIPNGTGISLTRNPTMDQENDPSLPLTHFRMGAMLALLGNFAVAVTHSSHAITNPPLNSVRLDAQVLTEEVHGDILDEVHEPHTGVSNGVPLTYSMTLQEDDRSLVERLEGDEQSAFYARLSIALILFVIFWMAGAAIFMKTEQWSFGIAVYFCFISFTTVGYGDYSPKTPAGRSIFVVWALLGVATVTILISVISEAYSTRYKSIIRSEVYDATAETMRVSQGEKPAVVAPNSADKHFFSNFPSTLENFSDRDIAPEDRPLGDIHLNWAHIPKPPPTLQLSDTPEASCHINISNGESNLNTSKVLAQITNLKSIIAAAREPGLEDGSQTLTTLLSHLENGLCQIEQSLDTHTS